MAFNSEGGHFFTRGGALRAATGIEENVTGVVALIAAAALLPAALSIYRGHAHLHPLVAQRLRWRGWPPCKHFAHFEAVQAVL